MSRAQRVGSPKSGDALPKNGQVTVQYKKNGSGVDEVTSVDLYYDKGVVAFLPTQKTKFDSNGIAKIKIKLDMPNNSDIKLGKGPGTTNFKFKSWANTREGPHCTTFSDDFKIAP
ncbi:hypothetical protein G9A89_006381 [Geosiphon pyriformis]|nr:hypothetical protein G9A89_006381 [Geosiphon pyriformis]